MVPEAIIQVEDVNVFFQKEGGDIRIFWIGREQRDIECPPLLFDEMFPATDNLRKDR